MWCQKVTWGLFLRSLTHNIPSAVRFVFFSLSVKVTMQLIKHFLSSKASSHFLYVFLALLFRVPSLELGKMDVQRSRLEIFAVRTGFRRDANIVCCKQNSLKTLSSTHAYWAARWHPHSEKTPDSLFEKVTFLFSRYYTVYNILSL